jgi:hypothetical protein
MQVKALQTNAIAQYRKSKDCFQQGLYGEEVARLLQSESLFKKALEFSKSLQDTWVNELKVILSF